MDKFYKKFFQSKQKVNHTIEPMDFLKIIVKTLNILGLPLTFDSPKTKWELFLLCFKKFRICFSIMTIFMVTIGYILWPLINHKKDPLITLRTLPNISNHIFFVSRYVNLFRKRKNLKGIFFNLKDIIDSCNNKYDNLIRKYYEQNRRFQLFSVIFTGLAWLSQIIDFIYNYFLNGTQIFSVQMWLPFDHNSGLKYFASCLIVLWGGIILSIYFCAGDWIIFTTITLYTMAFDMIGNRMKEILNISTTKIEDLKEIVTKHYILMSSFDEFKFIISEILILNFLQAISLLSLFGFQMIVLDDMTQLAVYGFLTILLFSQMFLLSLHGQMLINSSSNIAELIYQSEWYEIKDLRIKRIIPFMMQRCQAYKYLSACGFVVISMETFTSVIYFMNFL